VKVLGAFVLGLALGTAVAVIHGDELPSDDVLAAAQEANVDPLLLLGAVNTTHLDAHEYLFQVGELARPVPPTPSLGYLRMAYGALGDRIWCVMGIESHWGAAMWNPQPWGRFGEHAQGWAGWLPSTWRTTPPGRRGAGIGDFYAEAEGVAWMIGAGRGNEFAGIAWRRC
jgi:hypothetical protein